MKEQKSSDDAHAPTPAESVNRLNAMSFMRGWLGQDEKNRPAIAKSVEAERKLKRDLALEEIADQKNRQKKVKSEAPVHIINGEVVSIMERIDITDENKEGELNSVSTQFTKIIAPIQHLDPASPADSIDSQQTLPLGSPPSKSKDISATNALLLLAAADIGLNRPIKAMAKSAYELWRAEYLRTLMAKDSTVDEMSCKMIKMPREVFVELLEGVFRRFNQRMQRGDVADIVHLAIKLGQHPKSTESEKKFLEHLGALAESAVYTALLQTNDHVAFESTLADGMDGGFDW